MIDEILRRIKNKRAYRRNPRNAYTGYLESLPVDEKAVLAEGSRGSSVDGNTFYLVRELVTAPEYEDIRVYVVTSDDETERRARAMHGDRACQGGRLFFVRHGSEEYYRRVATCRYLINDATFAPFFIKRDNQVFLNTWHGTPLKTMGRRNSPELDVLGNVQRNLCMADYILSPNPFTEEIMTRDYMINDICRGRQVRCGYPRNSVFYDENCRTAVRERLELEGLRTYAYLPTWRGLSSGADEDANRLLEEQLRQLDELLEDDEIMLAKLHHLSRTSMAFGSFRHIRCFPEDEETYMVLNAADLLVTDYSSVMFDYAVSGKSVILFTYDKEEYERGRGLNIGLDKLPFERAENAEELVRLLRHKYETPDAGDFTERFIPWDRPDAARELAAQLIRGCSDLETAPAESNGKENILIYSGNLEDEFIEAARECLSEIGDSANCYIGFYSLKDRERADALRQLLGEFEDLRYLEFRGAANRCDDERFKWIYEYRRLLGSMRIDRVIVPETEDDRMVRLLEGSAEYKLSGDGELPGKNKIFLHE